MRRLSRWAFFGWLAVSAGGCAAITGLDSITEQDCAPNCDDAQASHDVTVPPDSSSGGNSDVQTTPDQSSGGDVAPESAPPEAAADGPHESSVPDAGKEGGPEAGSDAKGDVAADAPPEVGPDAPFDSGCGPLNTTDNCSACGDKCASTSTSVTSASCTGAVNGAGASCQYTCATGYLDCDQATNPPDLNGCECHAPGATQSQCCATSGGNCPIQHINGLGQASSIFWDCVLAGTMNSQLAQDACIAYVGAANAAQCQPYGEPDASLPDSWCSGSFTGDCICWTFSGQYAGTVLDPAAQGLTPTSSCYYGPSSTTFQ